MRLSIQRIFFPQVRQLILFSGTQALDIETTRSFWNLDNYDLAEAKQRIRRYMDAFRQDGTRITQNLDFDAPVPRREVLTV